MEQLESPPGEPTADFAFGLRPGEAGDASFIADSWRRTFDDSPTARCPGGLLEYIATQRQVIAQALGTSAVLVAYQTAPSPTPAHILGWVCYRRPRTVHYVYVKPYYRRAGIGRALLDAALERGPAVFTSHDWRRPRHKAPGIWALVQAARARGLSVTVNPALIFGGP